MRKAVTILITLMTLIGGLASPAYSPPVSTQANFNWARKYLLIKIETSNTGCEVTTISYWREVEG